MTEKCFCHFNGYEVKDAKARKKLDNSIKLHILRSESTQDISLMQIGDINILIDAGKVNNNNDTYNDKTACSNHIAELKNLGVEKIDYIYITHYHADHIGGLLGITDSINANGATIFCPEVLTAAEITDTKEDIADNISNVNTVIASHNLNVIHPTEQNHIFNIGGVNFDFRNFDKSYYFKAENRPADYAENGIDYNDLSLCCIVTYGAVRVGFFGDISYIAQKRLAGTIGHLDLMSVEHHGLNSWLYSPFYDNIAPKMCFTQDGFGNAGRKMSSNNKPIISLAHRSRTQTYLQDNGIPNFPTSTNGSITFNIFWNTITTTADAVKYASKSIKSTTNLLGSINTKYGGSTNLSLLTILKNMEHGLFISTRIDHETQSKLWAKLVDPFTPDQLEHAQIILYKGGSAGYNQFTKDYGYILVMPETSNPLIGIIHGQWDTNDYSTINIKMRPIAHIEHFKFWRDNNDTTFSKSSTTSNYITPSGVNLNFNATGTVNYSIYLRNTSSSAVSYTYTIDGSSTTESIPARDVFIESNITNVTSGDSFIFPDVAGIYVRITGFMTYSYGRTIEITDNELDNTIPSFNDYPLF